MGGGGDGDGNGRLRRHGLSCYHSFMAGDGLFWSVFHGSTVLVADAKFVRVDGWYGDDGGDGGYTVPLLSLAFLCL